MAIIQRSMDNIYNLNSTISNIDTIQTDHENRITTLEQTVWPAGATAPTVAQGATAGDIWYNTTTGTFNVYREYPALSGTFSWEPLIYHDNDNIDGGTW